MSGVVAVAGRTVTSGDVQSALGAMQHRGGARPQTLIEAPFAMACARHMWEFANHLSGPVSLLDDGRLVVAADASVYYRSDLLDAMTAGYAGPRVDAVSAPTPTHLIAAAYRRWGADFVRHLEGDFSFVVFDREEGRLIAARDFAGFRPLYVTELGAGLGVASSVGALLVLGASEELDPVVLAALAGGLHRAAGPETAYRHIRAVHPGHTLTWSRAEGLQMHRHWEPPSWGRIQPLPFDEAAKRLRVLLADSIRERLAPGSTTSVPLSGGWDSTAVYAIGKWASPEAHTAPISISYPEGDPGREDDLIRETLGQWSDTTHWLQVDDIDLFDGFESLVARQDLPFVHLYERWNRAIAEGGAEDGASVQFSGYGGDQLFQVSLVYLADLVRQGRVWKAWSEWRLKKGSGVKEFLRWAVVPNVPAGALNLWARLRGGRLHQYLDRPIPHWFDPEFVTRERLREREEIHLPSEHPGSHAEREWRWFLLHPYFPLVASLVADFCMESGLESRSPLYDRRIVEFCATRPATDLSWGIETKRLLREATRGLVPDAVLAPRPYRTGVTSAYANRQFEARFPEILKRLCAKPFRLAELGIIRADVFQSVCAPIIEGRSRLSPDQLLGMFSTVVTELWLRSRTGSVDR